MQSTEYPSCLHEVIALIACCCCIACMRSLIYKHGHCNACVQLLFELALPSPVSETLLGGEATGALYKGSLIFAGAAILLWLVTPDLVRVIDPFEVEAALPTDPANHKCIAKKGCKTVKQHMQYSTLNT